MLLNSVSTKSGQDQEGTGEGGAMAYAETLVLFGDMIFSVKCSDGLMQFGVTGWR